jgi:hypothetical protein
MLNVEVAVGVPVALKVGLWVGVSVSVLPTGTLVQVSMTLGVTV